MSGARSRLHCSLAPGITGPGMRGEPAMLQTGETAMPGDSAPGDGAVRHDKSYELRVVVLLGLAFGFAYFDRMALTFLAPFVQADLGLSNEELGWANSGLSLTWALGAFLIGRWSDVIGKRKPFL